MKWIIALLVLSFAGLNYADNAIVLDGAKGSSVSAATGQKDLKKKRKRDSAKKNAHIHSVQQSEQGLPLSRTATEDSASNSRVAKKQHWVCPMHDGGESDHPGKCPKCGMDLILEP
jgi:hypothetical protein